MGGLKPDVIACARRAFARSNADFSEHKAVFDEASAQLLGRLDTLRMTPSRILDLGCRTGYQLEVLQQRFPQASITGFDPAPCQATSSARAAPWFGLWRRQPAVHVVAGDPHHLPFKSGSFDLVVSNLLLPWCHEPHQCFLEVARVLAPGGAFLFTAAGPDTLTEYRALWAAIDFNCHAFGLVDMHDLGDSLLAAGFDAPVLDRQMMNVDYADVEQLQAELRALGACNIATGRRRGLMAANIGTLLERQTDSSGRFVVSLELIHGHGWKSALSAVRKNTHDEFSINVENLRGSWKSNTANGV